MYSKNTDNHSYQCLFCVWKISGDLLHKPISPETVIFYITQDTQRHPLLPELKSGAYVLLIWFGYKIYKRKEFCFFDSINEKSLWLMQSYY